jgi:V8-like Glu-specific endopeptidase
MRVMFICPTNISAGLIAVSLAGLAPVSAQQAPGAQSVTQPQTGPISTSRPVVAETVAPALPPLGEVRFKSVLPLKQSPGAQPQLRHAEEARTADWPAVLYATFETERGTAVCTAALIGPKAMLTAAHCVPASGVVSFEYAAARFDSDCERHPRYITGEDASADFALCKVRDDPQNPDGVRLPTGAKFERIVADPMDTHVSLPSADPQSITLTGFGCISDIVRDNKIDEKFRVGRTYFVESSNTANRQREAGRYAPAERNNLITVDDAEYANLCPGDSGGPAYAYRAGQRQIVGVNSRVFFKDATRRTYGASLVSATGGPDFYAWARNWAKAQAKVSACGLNAGTGCP